MRVSVASLLVMQLIPAAWLHCYQLHITGFRKADTPEYRFEMQLHKNNSLSTVTRVLREVPIPMWNILLRQYDKRSNFTKTLYDTSLRSCDFWQTIKRVSFFKSLPQVLFNKYGNMSLKCPLAAGTYVMPDIRVPPETPILKFLYVPHTMLGLFGKVYSQLPNQKKIVKASYEINGTVIKSC